MNELIKILKKISEDNPLDQFNWDIPSNSPVAIPETIHSGYEKNVYLKENFHPILNKDDTLKSHYWAIQEWGGIGSFKKNEKNDKRIRKFLKDLEKENLTKNSFKCISSLSKVASFAAPEKYAIYDSRAIYSLNWMLFNYSEERTLFPQPEGRSTDLAKYNMQTIFRLSKSKFEFKSHKTAFNEYCQLLNELSPRVFGSDSKPYKLEILLFMIAPTWVINNIKSSVILEIKKNV
jgi:hypothetical protein